MTSAITSGIVEQSCVLARAHIDAMYLEDSSARDCIPVELPPTSSGRRRVEQTV